MRLFVALTPPAEVVEELRVSTAALRAALPEPAPVLRWTRPEQWHLTLVFLGEVGDDSAATGCAGWPIRPGRPRGAAAYPNGPAPDGSQIGPSGTSRVHLHDT